MEFGWLLQGAAGLVGQTPLWLRDLGSGWPAVLGGVVVIIVLAVAALVRRRRQHVEQVLAEHVKDEATLLKDRLRQRLSEPASLFSNGINTAPTMGACEAFEGDIEAAARTILVEGGGDPGEGKQKPRREKKGGGAPQRQPQRSEGGDRGQPRAPAPPGRGFHPPS